METDNQKIIEQAYIAFNGRDIPGVLKLMHPDVRWPKAFEGSFVSGHGEVEAYWQHQWTGIDPHVEPIGYSYRDDGSFVVDVRQIVRDLTGNVLASGTVKHVYTFQDGLIREMSVEAG